MFFNIFSGLRGRVLTISGFMIFLFVIQTLVSFRSISSLNSTINNLAKDQLPQMQFLSEVKASSQGAPRNLWLALAYDNDEGERAKYSDRTLTHLEILKDNIQKINENDSVAEQKRSIDSLKQAVTKLEQLLPHVMQKLDKNSREADIEARAIMMTELPPIAGQINDEVDNLSLAIGSTNDQLIKSASGTYSFALGQTVVTAIISSILAIIVALVLSSRLVNSFSSITASVANASSQVSSASQGLSRSSEQLAADAQSQASAIVETSAAVVEITRMVDANVNASENATAMAEEIHGLSQKTKGLMGELSHAMKSILESNQRIENLVRIIAEIGEKTEIIDEIVFKTQLLSFNASVEAERAGEHGRGFAVVAQEVGNLAQMSGKAATEIAAIVKASIREADQVSAENKSRVLSGDELALQTQGEMNSVITKIEDVLNANKLIVTASREQLSGLQQVTSSMENLNLLTQKSANMSEDTSSSSDELKSQSSSLMDLVEELRHIVHGNGRAEFEDNRSFQSGNGEHKVQKLARYSELEDRLKNWKVS